MEIDYQVFFSEFAKSLETILFSPSKSLYAFIGGAGGIKFTVNFGANPFEWDFYTYMKPYREENVPSTIATKLLSWIVN